jgi:hypothetical protein
MVIGSRSRGYSKIPMMTPRETPEKVMTSNKFSISQVLKLVKVTFFISGFSLNFPGSVK